jgi:hypothetical protein
MAAPRGHQPRPWPALNTPDAAPLKNDTPQTLETQTLETFHVHLLGVLAIAFVGVGITAIGFAGRSPATVGLGAGAVVAAGLIAGFFAYAGYRRINEKKSVHTSAASTLASLTPEDPGIARDENKAAQSESLQTPLPIWPAEVDARPRQWGSR